MTLKIDINLINKIIIIMSSDMSKSQTSKNKKIKSKQKDEIKNKKRNESSDDDDWISDEEDEFDMDEYRKLLSNIFPSKHMQDKVNSQKSTSKKNKESLENDNEKMDEKKLLKYFNKMKSLKNNEKESEAEKDDNKEEGKCNKEHKKKQSKKTKSSNKKSKTETESEDDSEYDDDEFDEEYDDEFDSDDAADLSELFGNSRSNKFNIIFTLADPLDEDEDMEFDEEYSDSDYNESNDDISSDEDDDNTRSLSKIQTRSMTKQKKSKHEQPIESDKEKYSAKKQKNKKKNNKTEIESEDDVSSVNNEEVIENIEKLIDGMPESYKNNKIVKEHLETLEKQKKNHEKIIAKKEKKQRIKNLTKFKKQLREKNVMNDAKFFKENLTLSEQKLVLQQIEELKEHCDIEKPYRLSLLNADIPVQFKACAYKKLSTLRYMEPGGGEYYKIKNWVDTFMRIPFGMYSTLPIQISDGIEKCHSFMENAKQTLDTAVYGLNDAKLQIMQMVGQWITNPDAIGSAIAIKGPMGTGKTTLVKEGISKILNREFAFIALGGATDSSFLEGHSYTYEGSTWGKIVDILVKCKCMNPVIYFDELDKVSDTPKGEEIIGILTHLTDTSQNSKYHDKYFAELDFDLSRCLFIFSYNDEDKVNPILKDRMYRIQTRGYKDNEKVEIAKNYLLPKIREQIKFDEKDIIIPDEVTKYIINELTDKEDGVRNLKRCLEIIYTKLNLYRLMKPGTNLFDEDMKLNITFPVTVTNEIVNTLIKKTKKEGNWRHMYM